jgi:hypothetical protein
VVGEASSSSGTVNSSSYKSMPCKVVVLKLRKKDAHLHKGQSLVSYLSLTYELSERVGQGLVGVVLVVVAVQSKRESCALS